MIPGWLDTSCYNILTPPFKIIFHGTRTVQGVPNSMLTIGISETIKDTRSVKWGQSCAIWCSLKRRFEISKIPNTSEDLKKTKIRNFFFIFLWLYLNKCNKIHFTFLLLLFLFYKVVLSDFQTDVSSLSCHHQLCF